jgi:AraC-like DNA-binding protein
VIDWDMPRLGAGAEVMVGLARDHGLTAETALRGTGLTLTQLDDPAVQISTRQEFAVVSNVVTALGDPVGLGVQAGMRFQLPLYGAFAFALISSATVGSAVATVLRSMALTYAFTDVTAETRGDDTYFVFTADGIPEPLRRFVIERDIAGVRRLQCEIFADPAPLAVEFAFPAPPEEALLRYDEAFGVRPSFAARATAVVAAGSLLALPMPEANARIQALAVAQCGELLEQRKPRRQTGRAVRDDLVRTLGTPPDARAVARRMHIGDRTLRERLAAEGTSFRALVEEVRERFAEEFLAAGMPVSEIAGRLGYREVSSFSQAFRRWKGVGPRDYRNMMPTRGR